jgi:alpha-beta hydrolase superfamily lysophospholipase
MPPPHLNLDVRWEPGAVGIVSIVHGAGDHSGRYEDLRQALARASFATAAVDLRGHGLSDGARLDVRRFEEYADDYEALRSAVDAKRNGLPHFLLGHSMGTFVALQSAVRWPEGVAGLVLMSAPVRPKHALSRLAARCAAVVRPLVPKLRLPLGFPREELSSDPASVAAAREDSLLRTHATLRWGAEFQKAATAALDDASRLAVPVLVLHGTDDRIADLGGARRLFDAIKQADKTFRTYPGAFHELFAEVSGIRLAVFEDIVAWLRAHAVAAPPARRSPS